MTNKVAATAPEAVAAAVNWLRGRGAGAGAPGAVPGPSHIQRAVQYVQPATDALAGIRQDYGAVAHALDSIVPGTKAFLDRQVKGRLANAAHGVLDHLEEHGPEYREGLRNRLVNMVDRVTGPKPEPPPPPPPAPWYHDRPTLIGAGLGAAGLTGLIGAGVHKVLSDREKEKEEAKRQQLLAASTMMMANRAPMSVLGKISSALDLIAEEIDARPVFEAAEEKVASEEPANVFGQFYEFYKQQVGEEPPAALVEKLAQDADEETLSALQKLVKRAGMERPTPLGEPSEGGGYRAPPSSRGDATKMAWEQFEETLLNYESA